MGSLPHMTPTSPVRAQRPAETALLAGLVDDAAVFPPGNAPLPQAVRSHRAHRTAGYAGLVGPLLVPVGAASELVALVADGDAPTRVVAVARPGTPVDLVEGAVATLKAARDVELAGVELGWTPQWRDAQLDGLHRTLEVPRGDGQPAALDDIARDASRDEGVQAKFRTGATSTWAWPDETELATFVRSCVDRDLGFKLTGGLHHLVRGEHDGEPQHGLLNVLVAVRWALNGEEVDELVPLLAERDPQTLVDQVVRMSAADAAIVRAFFTAYGCCEVTDPIGELTTLGLVEGA